MTEQHSGDTTNGSAVTTSGDDIKECETINRDPGTPTGLGAVVGGGYRGKREDQDKAVQELATRLNSEFDHDITVRFNTNQLSGGAWLKDNNQSSQVGLGVNLKPPEWYLEQRHEYVFGDAEEPDEREFSLEDRQLVTEVKADVPVVDEKHANNMTDRDDRTSYAVIEFDEIDEAWSWFVDHINRDAINPPQ
jgi:hypothetical protein